MAWFSWIQARSQASLIGLYQQEQLQPREPCRASQVKTYRGHSSIFDSSPRSYFASWSKTCGMIPPYPASQTGIAVGIGPAAVCYEQPRHSHRRSGLCGGAHSVVSGRMSECSRLSPCCCSILLKKYKKIDKPMQENLDIYLLFGETKLKKSSLLINNIILDSIIVYWPKPTLIFWFLGTFMERMLWFCTLLHRWACVDSWN